ncbi:hypothetical protein PF010_g29860 [Phytophthora fragariae]|uniref:Uncharacterized protein n=1 Tax=Phytophthora fragariae TaxID=53985 RepID=A0A6G0JM09_9STRA|nr:hypothetical protein PF010_g29860 [Phytophthora fragariae]
MVAENVLLLLDDSALLVNGLVGKTQGAISTTRRDDLSSLLDLGEVRRRHSLESGVSYIALLEVTHQAVQVLVARPNHPPKMVHKHLRRVNSAVGLTRHLPQLDLVSADDFAEGSDQLRVALSLLLPLIPLTNHDRQLMR